MTDALYELPPSHQRKGKGGKGRETYKMNTRNFTNNTGNTNTTNNTKRNNLKYTKPILSFPELHARHWHAASSCRAAPGCPRLDMAVGRNWTQGHTDLNLDQDHR